MSGILDLKIAIDFLLKNGYLAHVDNQLVITNKLRREFNPIPADRVEALFPDNPEIIDKKMVWAKFIQDAQVPYNCVGTDGRKYTIRQYGSEVADILVRIIRSCDYKVLVESTKRYYQSNSFKVILSNYFKKDIWREEYNRYEQDIRQGKKPEANTTGGNPFED